MSAAPRSPSWKWWVCGLLLLASAINYMDRQTLANAAVRITRELQLSEEQYGNLERNFGLAFAAGSLLFGVLADRVPVRWLYPVVLLLWSAAGFATGLVHTYGGLLLCRTFLGLFEAGHWPCALKTTQRLLEAKERTMGNSVLQSGASIGSIATPIIMNQMLTAEAGSWRFPFQAIAAAGALWIVAWLALVRVGDLMPASSGGDAEAAAGSNWSGFLRAVLTQRFLALLVIVMCINTSWQLLRAWLPKFLIQGRGYPEPEALYFNSLYYLATDVGCLAAGALTLWLHQKGITVHGARALVYLLCALLTALAVLAAVLPKGWLLLGVLLVVGAGALGLFPCYYALSQEISKEHQGKVTGLGSVFAWVASAPAHVYFGRWIDSTGSFDAGIAAAGLLPLVGFFALWLLWDRPKHEERSQSPA